MKAGQGASVLLAWVAVFTRFLALRWELPQEVVSQCWIAFGSQPPERTATAVWTLL